MFPSASSLLQPTSGAQGTSLTVQPAASGSGNAVQGGAVAPTYGQTLTGAGANNTAAVLPDTSVATTATAGTGAADPNAAQAATLRSQIAGLIQNVKDIFNSRYGSVDASAAAQTGNLNTRFGQESGDLAKQVVDTNNQIGASYAGRGAYDSSYRGNDVDTTTAAGNNQVRDLGTELHDNIAKIAEWVAQQKAGFDAQKGGLDTVASHLADETDPNNLISLRNQIDAQIANLQGGSADNNTPAQNASALEAIAPSSARAVQLKTTLGQIAAGNADPAQKLAIGQQLIASAGLTPDDQQKLAAAFQSDVSTPQPQTPTA